MTDAWASLMPTYAPAPVTFVRGKGSRLFDADGRAYLDFIGGLAVTSLGHAHPVVAEALATQARTLLHVSNLFRNELAPEVATTIDRLLGGGGRVFFCNSGAEANECAIKLARRWAGRRSAGPGSGTAGPGRHGVVSLEQSFHGRTLAAMAATGQPAKQAPFQPLPPGFRSIAIGDSAALAEALSTGGVGAVLLEPLQGEGGVNEVPDEWLVEVRALCDASDVLLVLDEVQTGLGRTGRWFGFEHSGIRPDVVTLAKALGNGVPVGACWARAEVADAFVPGDHGTTFGGQPLALAAARAVLEVMEAEDVSSRAAKAGDHLRSALLPLPGVASVRGRGLLLAAELAGRPSADVTAAALGRGLVVQAVTPTAVRLAPSLLVAEAEIDEAVAILAAVLGDVPPVGGPA